MSTKNKVFPKFSFFIDRYNKFVITDREVYERYRKTHFPSGSKGFLILKPRTRPRSSGQPGEKGNQNGWFHAVILPMAAEDRGYEIEELKEAYIQAFAPDKIVKDIFTGKEMIVKKRTSEMTTVEFMEFCESIRREEAERGLIIPDPEKVDTE